jgi:hypothetical protein
MVNQYKWHADVNQWTVYARNQELCIRMHVFIMRPRQGFIVNHIDRDGLNNTRDNLQILTQSEHSRLSSRRKDATLQYRGVQKHKSGRFRAQIRINGKNYHLGYFKTEVEAAQAWNDAGERMLGRGKFIMNEVDLDDLFRATQS